jgi:hypothetical protein
MHTTSAYSTDKIGDETKFMEGENPYSPIGGARMSYDISDMNAEDDEGVFHPTVDYNSNTKGKGKSKGKAKGKAKGKNKRAPKDPDYMVIPPFGAAVTPYSSAFYAIHSFFEAQNPYAVRQPTPREPSLIPGHCVMLPDDTLVCPRLAPNKIFDKNIQTEYHKALQAIFQMKISHNSFYVQELGIGCAYYVNLNGQKVGVYDRESSKYELPNDDQRASLGDFWKVLRVRPTPTGARNSWTTYEYLSNNMYSYYKVKKTLKQVHGYVIKPSRYWNETCTVSVQDHILYSLAKFCPGMPREADIRIQSLFGHTSLSDA